MHRVKRFRGIADIGCCASKKTAFDGLKLHLQATDQGLSMGYVVTKTSCHDRVAAETIMTQIPHPYNLGDKGYISQKLQKKLYEEHRVAFWTPVRKNQRIRQSDAWKQVTKCRQSKIHK
jgi:hypothetical protein